MAEVMKPWSASPSPVRDPTLPQQLAKGVVDRLAMVRTSTPGREEDGVREPVALGSVPAPQALAQGRRQRNQTIFAELPLADDQDTSEEVHLSDAQVDGFAHAQATAIKHVEDLGQDEMPQGGTWVEGDGICGAQ